jgi:hypothetical protein
MLDGLEDRLLRVPTHVQPKTDREWPCQTGKGRHIFGINIDRELNDRSLPQKVADNRQPFFSPNLLPQGRGNARLDRLRRGEGVGSLTAGARVSHWRHIIAYIARNQQELGCGQTY